MADDNQDIVREAVAVFDDAESMESAVDEILSAGFDRAEVSLLSSEAAVEEKLGHAYERVKDAIIDRMFDPPSDTYGVKLHQWARAARHFGHHGPQNRLLGLKRTGKPRGRTTPRARPP